MMDAWLLYVRCRFEMIQKTRWSPEVRMKTCVALRDAMIVMGWTPRMAVLWSKCVLFQWTRRPEPIPTLEVTQRDWDETFALRGECLESVLNAYLATLRRDGVKIHSTMEFRQEISDFEWLKQECMRDAVELFSNHPTYDTPAFSDTLDKARAAMVIDVSTIRPDALKSKFVSLHTFDQTWSVCPFLDRGHYVLLLIHPATGAAYGFDSMNRREQLRKAFYAIDVVKQITYVDCPDQFDSPEANLCGFAVCAFVERFVQHGEYPFPVDVDYMEMKRKMHSSNGRIHVVPSVSRRELADVFRGRNVVGENVGDSSFP